MSQFRGVILDVDGTLVDSNDAHAHAWVEVLRERGYEVSFKDIRPLIGMGGDKLLPKAVGVAKESAEGKAISEARAERFEDRYLPELEAFAKTRELLLALQERGFKLVVASSAKGEELGPLLELAGVDDLIESQTSSSDAEESKPEPDIVQAALEKLGLPVREVVMIGDTPYDLEAATKAGVPLIAVRSGGWADEDLEGALAIYDDPADLLANLERSPFA